jgi:hypothetical protein
MSDRLTDEQVREVLALAARVAELGPVEGVSRQSCHTDVGGFEQVIRRGIPDAYCANWCEAQMLAMAHRLPALAREVLTLRQLQSDDAERDARARELARSVLPAAQVDGDSHGVPNVADIVAALVRIVERLPRMADGVPLDAQGAGERGGVEAPEPRKGCA